MVELSIKTIAIIILCVIAATVALIWIFSSSAQQVDIGSKFFNLTKNITANASETAGKESSTITIFN